MNVQSIGHLSILILVFQFSACADAPKSGQQNAVKDAKFQEVQQDCARLSADSSLDPIRRKAPINHNIATPISVEMMANSQFPTEDEAQLILRWAKIRQDCQQRMRNILGEPPAHMAALQMAKNQAMAELYARRITYGQFSGEWNKYEIAYKHQDQASRSQAQRDAAQAQQSFSQQLLQQQQIDLQRQQLLNEQFQRPPVSNSVNCTTQYVGNTAFTNCN